MTHGRTGARRHGRRVAVLPAVLLTLSAPSAALAQSLRAVGLVYNVEHRVLYEGAVLQQTGIWAGGGIQLSLGAVSTALSGLIGSLGGGDDPANPERKVRSSVVAFRIHPVPWLELGPEAEARRFEADIGTTVWRMVGGGARVTSSMGVRGLEAAAEVSYFPSATVIGGDRIALAFRGTVGASYVSPTAPVWLRLAYRFERFDFEAQGSRAQRLEQFRGIVAGVGLWLGR